MTAQIESYLALGDAEQAASERRVRQGGHMAIKELEMTWADRMRAEGERKGREEGALLAKREVLIDLARTRFGALPEALTAQVAQADETWLTQMLRRAATASNLDELTSP